MKRSVFYPLVITLLLVSLFASACTPAQPTDSPPPEQPTATQPPEQPTETQPQAEEKVVLNIMDNWGTEEHAKGPVIQSIFEDFEKEYPNIEINEEVFADTEIATKVETAFLAGKEPDIVFQNFGSYGGTDDWVESGVAIDVTDLLEEWDLKSSFHEHALENFTGSQGRVHAFPLEGFTFPLWYNMAILNEAGVTEVPKTVDDLIDAADKVRAAGYQPMGVGGADISGAVFLSVVTESMMTAEEIEQVYTNGGFSENEGFVKGVELFVRLRDEGVFVDNVEGTNIETFVEMFFSGEAAMMRDGSWHYGTCPEELFDDVVLAGFPLAEGTPREKPVVVSSFIAKGVWVTRNGAKKMDAVEKFITFFYRPENIARFVEETGMTPPMKEIPIDDSKANPLFFQTLKWGDSVEYVASVDSYIPGTAMEDFVKISKQAYLPGTTAEEILTMLDQAWEFATE